MDYRNINDQIAELGAGFPIALLDELLNANAGNGIPKALMPFFQRQESESDAPVERTHTQHVAREAAPPLQKVAPGPWRSLGGFLDYSDWTDRERFMELDRAIAAAKSVEEEEEPVQEMEFWAASDSHQLAA